MDVQIKTIEPIRIVYTRATGPYMKSAMQAWQKLMQWPGLGPLITAPGTKFIGIGHDDPAVTAPENIRYDAAVSVTNEPDVSGDIHLGEIPGGDYGVYLHTGPYEGLQAVYDDLFSKWLPSSGREMRSIPAFEVYLNSPETTPPAELKTEIWVPLV